VTATIFAQIVGAIVTELQAAPAVSAHVYRARMRPLPAGALAVVCVRIGKADLQRGVGSGVPHLAVTAVAVECYARASAGTDVDTALDALLQSVITRLLANPSLGGLVGDINPTGVVYDFDADGEQTACAAITFDVMHVTPSFTF